MSHFLLSGHPSDGKKVHEQGDINSSTKETPAYFDISSVALNGLSSVSRPNSFMNKAPGYDSVEAYDVGDQTPTSKGSWEPGERRASQVMRKPVPLNSRNFSQNSFTAALLDEQQRERDNGNDQQGYEGARISQWGVGWRTPALMVALYMMGLYHFIFTIR